jgi:hypothetical protein
MFDYIINNMKMPNIMIILAVLAVLALAIFGVMQFTKKSKKEKFIMRLYRPTPVISVPENEWDPADILTASLPSRDGPRLVTQKGDYRRFNRV